MYVHIGSILRYLVSACVKRNIAIIYSSYSYTLFSAISGLISVVLCSVWVLMQPWASLLLFNLCTTLRSFLLGVDNVNV